MPVGKMLQLAKSSWVEGTSAPCQPDADPWDVERKGREKSLCLIPVIFPCSQWEMDPPATTGRGTGLQPAVLHRPASSACASAFVCSLTQMDVLWDTEPLAGWEVCAAALTGLQHSCGVRSSSCHLGLFWSPPRRRLRLAGEPSEGVMLGER